MSLIAILVSIFLVLVAGWLIFVTLKLATLNSEVAECKTRLRNLDKKLMQDNRQRYENLSSRIVRLENEVRSLQEASAAAKSHAAKAYAGIPREPPIPTAPPIKSGTQDNHGGGEYQDQRDFQKQSDFQAQLLADYNDLASEFTGVRRDDFVKKYSPVAVVHEAGRVVEQENGQFWLVRIEQSSHCVLVPIGKIAREWEKLYRSMNGLTAKQTFGDVFDLVTGGNFRVLEPAITDPLASGGTIKRLGKLQGI